MRRLFSVAILFLLSWVIVSAQNSNRDQSTDKAPQQQPIPFSHKLHSELGLECLQCHTLKEPGFAAGYPDEDSCMKCHTSIKNDSPSIRKLAEHHRAKKPVRWVKIYEVPEFVWFSHKIHHREAGVSCETCHGPVAQREVIRREKPISMRACMDCHTQHKAPNDCDLCHNHR